MPNFHYQLFRIQIALPPALMKGYFGGAFLQASQTAWSHTEPKHNLCIALSILFELLRLCFIL